MSIRKYTSHALLLSLCVHIALMFVAPVFLVHHFDTEKESMSAEILKDAPRKQTRRRALPRQIRQNQRIANAEVSDVSLPSSTYTLQVSMPKPLIHADAVPDGVKDTDMPQVEVPSPVSNIRIGSDIRTGLGVFDTAVMPGHGLIGEVFVPGSRIFQMPNFDQLRPISTFITANLDVPTRSYAIGFSMPDRQSITENFAIRFRAELKINTPAVYTFELSSDDGSQLYINGKLVVDNDGIHGTVSEQGSIKLERGFHPVEIRYFQGPRYRIALQWFYQPPNSSKKIVPSDVLYLPSEP